MTSTTTAATITQTPARDPQLHTGRTARVAAGFALASLLTGRTDVIACALAAAVIAIGLRWAHAVLRDHHRGADVPPAELHLARIVAALLLASTVVLVAVLAVYAVGSLAGGGPLRAGRWF